MINIVNKILKHKNKAIGDYIASLLVIVALTMFTLFFIGAIKDVETRIQIDQVARKYILIMETNGTLDGYEDEIIKELTRIKQVKNASVSWNGGSGQQGYGSPITLRVECEAVRTSWIPNVDITYEETDDDGNKVTKNGKAMWGTISRKEEVLTYVVTKQSIAKY